MYCDAGPVLSGTACAHAALAPNSNAKIAKMERLLLMVLFFLLSRRRRYGRQSFRHNDFHRLFHRNLRDPCLLIDPA